MKKKCGTVRDRAINYILALDAKQLPLEIAKDRFSEITGLYDRTTLKAYFGTQKHRSTRKMQRIARYGTGTFSFKTIELSQEVSTTKGYLEKMGLVTIEKRGSIWFMIVNRDAVLVPQLYERKQLSIENLSLSSNSQNSNSIIAGKEHEKTSHEVVSSSKLETNNNLQDEREKLVDKTVSELKLNPLELATLKVLPSSAGELQEQYEHQV